MTDRRSVEELVAEAGQWLDVKLAGAPLPSLLLVIGLGEGHLLDLLEKRAPDTRVLALEPDPRVAAAFRARRDWSSWISSGRLVYLVGPDYAGTEEAWRIFPASAERHLFLTHPSLERAPSAAAVAAARVLKGILFGARANAAARREFAPRYLVNTIRNTPAIVAGQNLGVLANRFRGIPAVIAAAGPSLDRNIDDLREVSGRGLLICVDTALRPLLTAGVSPHLAVALDPSELNARHFHALPPCPDTWLVSESALDPTAHRHFGHRTFWFRVSNHEPWPWYQELGLHIDQVEVWGSVLTAAFQVALLAGCDPVVFVGADLSYVGEQPYCRATTYEFDWAYATARGSDLHAIWRAWTSAPGATRLPDLRGVETTAKPALLSFRDWLLTHAARSGRRIVNATGAGLFFGEGVQQMPLTKVLPAGTSSASLVTLASAVRSAPLPSSTIAKRLRLLGEAIADGRAIPPAPRWAEFSGPAWDAAAVSVALRDAARNLSGRRLRRDVVEAQPAREAILRELPENVARWRSALFLAGERTPVTNAGDTDDPSGLMLEAMQRFRRICDVLEQHSHSLSLPPDLVGLQRLPLSAASGGWPAHIAWEVHAFEALLGMALPDSTAAVADSFFTKAFVVRERHPLGVSLQLRSHLRPETALTCALLALEWSFCVRSVEVAQSPSAAKAFAFVRALQSSVQLPDLDTGRADAEFIVTIKDDKSSHSVRLPVVVEDGGLARIETGNICSGENDAQHSSATMEDTYLLAESTISGGSAAVALRRARAPRLATVEPRVLSDGGMPAASISYVTPAGAVCTAPLTRNAFVVRTDGSGEPSAEWPRPIVNELPWQAGGLVAWGWSRADPLRGYLFYRERPGAPAIEVPLPFRPRWGAWWHNRLYLTCFPSGVGAWSPGEEPTHALSDISFMAIESDDTGVLLTPGVLDEGGAFRRRRATELWHWDGVRAEARPAGSLGAATGRASTADGWTATAFPESDIIGLQRPGGRMLRMVCYYAFRVAWLERSLLVSTFSGEILLFEDLLTQLHALSERDA